MSDELPPSLRPVADSDLPPSLRAPAPHSTPEAKDDSPSNFDVFRNASYKGAAGLPDSILNTPNRVLNLGKAAVGSVADLVGRPDLAPELSEDPDYTRRILEKTGLIKAGVVPQGGQKALDVLTQGAVGGALTGGASLPRTVAGAGMGALSSGAQGGVEALTGNKALGATAGLLAPRGVAKSIGGKENVSADVQKLHDEKVSMTPGQILGGGWQKTEDALTSIPFLGDAIKSAQRRGHETFNEAAANRALAPVGEKLPKGVKGNDAIAHVQDTLSDKYEALLSKVQGSLDMPLQNDLVAIRTKASTLPESQKKELDSIIQHEVLDEIKAHNGSGKSLKDIESRLGELKSNYSRESNYHAQQLGKSVGEIQEALRAMVGRSNPEHAAELAKINEGYANFKRIQRAGTSVAAKDGVFTPAQLHNAVKTGDRSKDKSQTARGEALLQDLSQPGKNVLSQTVPDSGTATRALVEAAMMAGGGAAAGGHGQIGAAAAGTAGLGLAGMGMYSKPVQALIQQMLLGPQGPALREAARRSVIPQAITEDKR